MTISTQTVALSGVCLSRQDQNRVPFGLRDGALVEASEVESGLACNCVCPSCKQPLQARKGRVRRHHFAHDPKSKKHPCVYGLETSVHLMAKQILQEHQTLLLPELRITQAAKDRLGFPITEEVVVQEVRRETFQSVELEQRLGGIRPDIIGYANGSPLLIEIAVTSFASSAKVERIRSLGLTAIEVDLRTVDHAITKEGLRERLDLSISNKRWLSNPAAIAAKRSLQDERKSRKPETHHTRPESIRPPTLQATLFDSPRPTKTPAPKPREVMLSKNDGNQRYFVCEKCGCLFDRPTSEIGRSTQRVACPNCGYHASTKSCL